MPNRYQIFNSLTCCIGSYSSTVNAIIDLNACVKCQRMSRVVLTKLAGKYSNITGATSESQCLSCDPGVYISAISNCVKRSFFWNWRWGMRAL